MKIAFGYKSSSGKDTCVEYLIEKYGGKKYSFSKYLYDILYYTQKICGFEIKKDRKFLQWIGTDWAREIDNNVWINLLLRDVKNDEKEISNFYCSDLRFINEFNALKENGWICIKLIRNMDFNERLGNGNKNHISENELDRIKDNEWDYIIYNNSNLKDLKNNLDKIIYKK